MSHPEIGTICLERKDGNDIVTIYGNIGLRQWFQNQLDKAKKYDEYEKHRIDIQLKKERSCQ